MKYLLSSAATIGVVAGSVQAGALDRSNQSVGVLFEQGRYIEFGLTTVSPDLSGNIISGVALPNGSGSGDIAPSYSYYSGAYKADLNDRWSYALIIDQPFLAEVDYATGTGYFAAGSDAEFNSVALTGLLQYNMSNGMSVYGGLRYQEVDANASIGFVSNYLVSADSDGGVGYVAGVAYEKPEIALRVSLTYNSEISHSNRTTETSNALGTNTTTTDLETPQSINLDFQTGIAPGTLLFGGIRWVDWSDFALTPANYRTLTSGRSLLSYEEDVTTYTLGVGRRLNEMWSVGASVAYEETTGAFFTNLGPSDGRETINLFAVYTQDKMKVTTGISYTNIGDTVTRVGATAPAASFDGNDAIAFGIKVGYTF